VTPPNLCLAQMADLAPKFEAGRDAHPNVWIMVAVGNRESYPPLPLLFMRAHSPIWRRWESRAAGVEKRSRVLRAWSASFQPQPDVSDAERRPIPLWRPEAAATSPAQGQPASREETAHFFGYTRDIEAFVVVAEYAGSLLDSTAECPPVNPLLAGAACNSVPLARWIARIYATLNEHYPALILRPPPTTDGNELYVIDPWEASVLTIRWLQTQARAVAQRPAAQGRVDGEINPDNRIALLGDTAAREYAATAEGFWLAAIPADLQLGRCGKHDPACGTVTDGRVALPWGRLKYMGATDLVGHAAFALLVFTVGSQPPEEMQRFLDFAAEAGAELVANPAAWAEPVLRPGSPAQPWIASLMFLCPPSAVCSVEMPGGCRLITQPWAASLAALREWHTLAAPHAEQNTAAVAPPGPASTAEATPADIPPGPPADRPTGVAAVETDPYQRIETRFRFERDLAVWHIQFDDEAGSISDNDFTGLKYIARLLAHPHQAIAADLLYPLQQVGADTHSQERAFDDEGRSAVKREAVRLKGEIEEARSRGALARVDELTEALQKLADSHAKDKTHKGKARRLRQTPLEQAAERVRKAIGAVGAELRKRGMTKLAAHLKRIKKETTNFAYRLEKPEPSWQVAL
jgi:hypothetical protein